MDATGRDEVLRRAATEIVDAGLVELSLEELQVVTAGTRATFGEVGGMITAVLGSMGHAVMVEFAGSTPWRNLEGVPEGRRNERCRFMYARRELLKRVKRVQEVLGEQPGKTRPDFTTESAEGAEGGVS